MIQNYILQETNSYVDNVKQVLGLSASRAALKFYTLLPKVDLWERNKIFIE